jgi:hypothetical protein
LDPGVQHQCVDRCLIEQLRCKTSDAVEARKVDRMQVGLMLKERWRGGRVPRRDYQHTDGPRPSSRFAASRPMPAVAPVITIRMAHPR